MLSYVLLNYVFLSVAPIEAMQGKIEIGMIAADYAFGEAGGRAMGITLSLLLISTVSAMLMAGPSASSHWSGLSSIPVVSQNKPRRYPHDCDLGGCAAQCGAGAVVKL